MTGLAYPKGFKLKLEGQGNQSLVPNHKQKLQDNESNSEIESDEKEGDLKYETDLGSKFRRIQTPIH